MWRSVLAGCNVQILPPEQKVPSENRPKNKKPKGVIAVARDKPEMLEEFEKLSWPDKARLKQENPAAYWSFIRQIQERERRKTE